MEVTLDMNIIYAILGTVLFFGLIYLVYILLKTNKNKPVEQTVLKQENKIKSYDVTSKVNIFDQPKKSLYWYMKNFTKSKNVLINMELTNGMHRSFLISIKDGGFKYMNKKYVIDEDSKYYNMDAKMYAYDYHEAFTLPIKRSIPVQSIRKTMSDVTEVEYTTNPETLEHFLISKVTENVLKAQQIDVAIKQIKLLLIITMIAAIAHLLLFIQKTGMLNSINIPGLS